METQFEKVALITGAGAVENAWEPIIRILRPGYDFSFDIDSANCFLALFVYQLRAMAHSESPNSKEYLKLMIRDYGLIKGELCRSLIFAEQHKEIVIRTPFYSILDKFICPKHIRSIQITTNWDTVIDKAVNYYLHSTGNDSQGAIEVFHLHGSVSSPETLFLPSEITTEPYRSKEESLQMRKDHASVLKAISECQRTILYGLSLDPLDAELAQILGLGWRSQHNKEIVIINPDYQKVAKRVMLLLNRNEENINVVAYSPEDLETKIQF